jgi:hypothetical protein
MAGTGQTSDGVIAAHPVRQHVRKMLDKLIAHQKPRASSEVGTVDGERKKRPFRRHR